MKKRKIHGATRYLSCTNEQDGYMELRKLNKKDKVSLMLTTVPLSNNMERMRFIDIVDIGDEKMKKYMFEDYTNQFNVLFTYKDLLKLKDIVDNKIKSLKLIKNG